MTILSLYTHMTSLWIKCVALQAWWQEKITKKTILFFCLNYVISKFLYLILSVIFFKLFIVLVFVGYFCLNLLFTANMCDCFHMSLTKIIILVNSEVRYVNWAKFALVF
jgi:hypothetical protein